MGEYRDDINAHYGAEDISARILRHLREAGKDLDALERDNLGAFDEFHGGGRASTRKLADLAGLEPGMRVLDVGSGVGGPARTLAAEYGCKVIGVDLTAAFVDAARLLSERVGLADAVEFHQASALDLPFDAGSFDAAWSQNVMMNIENKRALFDEVFRVLVPGGCFAFEMLCAGEPGELPFPVFWAAQPGVSFLSTPEDTKAWLAAAGFVDVEWKDNTEQVIGVSRKRIVAIERDGPPPLGLGVIVPHDVETKIRNGLLIYERGLGRSVQAVCRRP